jgi:hypothetical protein
VMFCGRRADIITVLDGILQSSFERNAETSQLIRIGERHRTLELAGFSEII